MGMGMGMRTRGRRDANVSARFARKTSLRVRWHRAFALLVTCVLASGFVAFVGTGLAVGTYQASAQRVEEQATIIAQLRKAIVADVVLISDPITAAGQAERTRTESAIRAGFDTAIAAEISEAAKGVLVEARGEWQAIVDLAGPPEEPANLATRGASVAEMAPKALALLDEAGSVGREDVRVDLARAARTNHDVMVVLLMIVILALVLAVSLSRRLSNDVLRPIGLIRDSANLLAAGELDHRVPVDRADELGDLAVSFNEMAEAIAGSQRSLSREATTDALSGLANRAAFEARLEAILAVPNRRSTTQAVLFVDIDDFKDVNDSLGHAAGDELLRVVATRLTASVRPCDVVARLGGDEFALLLDGVADPARAWIAAERVVAALSEPVPIGDRWASVGASVGLALRSEHSTLVDLMREADVAMYAAKGRGKNRVEYYDPDLEEAATARLQLRTEISLAALRDELVVEYQPLVNLDSGLPVGFEALVRWQHPTRGLLAPSEFIQVAEASGCIGDITTYVLRTAAADLLAWQQRHGLPELWVSVNISVSELDGPDFVRGLTDELAVAGLDPANLVVEVTETVLADLDGATARTLTELRAAGIRVALDDFGTGYASIGYLRRLPVDVLKIDRSFIDDVSDEGTVLLEAIVGMGHHLGLEVMPEGIEDLDQLRRLRIMGCATGQGFLMSPPVAAHAVDSILASPCPFPAIERHVAEISGRLR